MFISVRTSLVMGLLLFSASCLPAGTVFIVVHGTWAQHSAWHKPEGDFFGALEESAGAIGAHVVSFCWNSKNTHEARVQAAKRLERLIRSYPDETVINVVAHSHGANVANLASQFLAHQADRHRTIQAFYHLGAPVCIEQYGPDMDVVRHLYSFFSFRDFVQPVLGIFSREYPGHERIANIRVTLNGVQPDHRTLHHPEMGRWIPLIHELLLKDQLYGFTEFQFGVPGIVHFQTDKPLQYELDERRAELAQTDSFRVGLSRALLVYHAVKRLQVTAAHRACILEV